MEPLSDDALQALSAPALLDRTRSLVELMNRMAAELARTVRTAENSRHSRSTA